MKPAAIYFHSNATCVYHHSQEPTPKMQKHLLHPIDAQLIII